MKKICTLILLVLPIILANAQKPLDSVNLEKFNLKLIESFFDEQGGKTDKETNILRIKRNEYFKSETAKDANEIALHYLQAKRSVYGLSDNPDDMKIVKTIGSPSGKFVYFQQYLNNIPIYATNFTIHVNNENIVTYAVNGFRDVAKYERVGSVPLINNSNAFEIARQYLNITGKIIGEPKAGLVYFESIDVGLELAWKMDINPIEYPEIWQIFISAENGRIIQVADARIGVNGSGKVFIPNPLVSAGVSYGDCCSSNDCYLNNNGATNSCLDNQLVQVTLNDLVFENGVYKLEGPYCVLEDMESPSIAFPTSTDGTFHFTRADPEFAAVMCYYHVNLAARRILELGFNLPAGIAPLRADPDGAMGGWYRPDGDYPYGYPNGNYIVFGRDNNHTHGAEDADFIWHEYAHAIQFNLGNVIFPIWIETSRLMEGCSDYWATSYKRSLYPNNWAEFGLWYEMDNSGCFRRADLNLIYPATGSSTTGYLWTSVLMKIWGDIGRDVTDKLFLQTNLNLDWTQKPSTKDAALVFIEADIELYNGAHLCEIIYYFNEYGLVEPAMYNTITTNFVNEIVITDKTVNGCNIYVKDVNVTNNSKLILDATFKTTIDGTFSVPLGSTLQIK